MNSPSCWLGEIISTYFGIEIAELFSYVTFGNDGIHTLVPHRGLFTYSFYFIDEYSM
jgi:hypothetical protein